MKNKFYEKLKNIKVEEIMWEIRDSFRSEISYEFVDNICYLFLALIIKGENNLGEINKTIEKEIKNETSQNYLKRIMSKDKNNIIKQISDKYNEDELKAAILFSKPETFSEVDMVSTPEGVAKLAIELLDIEEKDTILDLGSGINSFLMQTYIKTQGKNLNGVEINTESLIVGSIRSRVLGLEINTIQGNILSQDFTQIKANKVFSNPPLGMNWKQVREYVSENSRLSSYFDNTKRTISGDWTYALSAYINQNKTGKSVVIMSNSGTWNKPDEIIRKALLEKGLIEGVISLPANIFTFTSMDLIMMIFSEGNKEVKMVDASQIYTKGRRINTLEKEDIEKIILAYKNLTEISEMVGIGEIEQQEYILNPKRYVGEKVEIENSVKLGDVVKAINRGSMITSKELDDLISEEKTNYSYLMLQDIRDGEIDKELSSLKELDESYDRYCIKDNNIIISKTSPFKIALARVEKNKKIIANGNLYFLEIDKTKINPVFLTNFLQSEIGIQQLNIYAKGSAIKSISIRDLKEIQIPNLPIEEQNKIGEEIELLDDELLVLQKQVDIIKDKKVKVIQEVI